MMESAGPSATGRRLRAAAFVLLMAVLAARCFLGEYSFAGSTVRTDPVGQVTVGNDPAEVSRAALAVLLVAAVGLWGLAGIADGQLTIRRPVLVVLMLAFVALSWASAHQASNRWIASLGFFEQASILAAGFLAIQLGADRRRFALLVIVLAGLAGAMVFRGVYQYFVEIPDRIADFEAFAAERLAELGFSPGSPQARSIRLRMLDRTPTGYFALANLFASLGVMILGATAAIAAEKVRFARQGFAAWHRQRTSDEIHLPTLAAVLSVLVAAAVAGLLVLTRSRGAIAAGMVAVVLAVGVVSFRDRLARHRKAWLVAVLAGVVLAGTGVVALGLARDGLPSRTMTFRWYYWTGAAEIIAERPVWGTGPGNFGSAYLPHRRAAAEEEVKAPHNLVASALAEYGLPGGLCYLAILGVGLAGLARPRCSDNVPSETLGSGAGLAWAVLAGSVTAWWLFWPPMGWAGLFMIILPVAMMAGALAAASWFGGRLRDGWDAIGGLGRIVLACGLVGFVAHNLVTFSLWAPATATVFWVALGACLGQGDTGRSVRLRWSRWLVPAATAAMMARTLTAIGMPLARRHTAGSDLTEVLHSGVNTNSIEVLHRYAACNGDDPIVAADAAKLWLGLSNRGRSPRAEEYLSWAAELAAEAVRRDPDNYIWWQMAGRHAFYAANPSYQAYPWLPEIALSDDVIGPLRRRVSANENDPHLLWELAMALQGRGRSDQAAVLFRKALSRGPAASLYEHLAQIEYRASRFDAAAAAWGQVVRLTVGSESSDQARQALEYLAGAVQRNPQNLRLRLEHAVILARLDRPAESLAELAAAEEIDSALGTNSIERFRPEELARIEVLRAWVGGEPAGQAAD